MPGLKPGEWLDGRYETLRLLGRGGMSEVYLARDLVSERFIALKVLMPELRGSIEVRRQFVSEGRFTARIVHEHVVELLDDAASSRHVPYLVFEALRGETLREYLCRRGTMPEKLVISLMIQAARGLEAAHERGIVHADLKPDNLFLCGPRGRPEVLKVLDFGLARVDGSAYEAGHETIAGTLEYMAPEQVVAEPVDPRSDVYALGVVMFRALTGELPFDTSPATHLVGHHLFSPAPPPSWLADGLDPRLETVVLTAMRKHPANRYRTMRDLREDLCRVAAGRDALSAPRSQAPDRYAPFSESGRHALAILSRSELFSLRIPDSNWAGATASLPQIAP